MLRYSLIRPWVRLTVSLGLALALGPGAWSRADEPAAGTDPLAAIGAYLRVGHDMEAGGATTRVNLYSWFAEIPPGAFGVEGVPVVVFRILPELAERLGDRDPEFPDRPLFGAPAQNFATFGFLPGSTVRGTAKFGFPPESGGRALPLGFSWTARSKRLPVSITVRTCAGCHIGRVRLDDQSGETRVIVGGPNTEILLHQYDAAITGFFKRHLQPPAERERLKNEVLKLIAEKQKLSPSWFFQNAPGYPAEEERVQVETLKADFSRPGHPTDTLTLIEEINVIRLAGRDLLHAAAYSKANSPPIGAGPPGFFDSSGLGLASFVSGPAELFPGATKNDIPSVWNQKTRKLFQWDGNVRETVTRNMVAALGVVGKPELLDVKANFLISQFIDGLPPAPYPFPVDAVAAARGKKIYEDSCLGCHRADQQRTGKDDPRVYLMGTDLNRARVVTPGAFLAIRQVVVDGYQPESLVFRYDGKEYAPCRIDPDELLIDRTSSKDQGYIANPLDGIWARAPYLHNGSVPTLRHLLVPKLRAGAATFVRGVISYDKKNVGWVWDPKDLPRYKDKDLSARIYDTALDGQSNKGHDRRYVKVQERDGQQRVYRLSWDDENDPDVNSLIEYLKTL